MKNRIRLASWAIMACLLALVAQSSAFGQQNINSVIDSFIASDFNSGYAQGSATGRNALATNITSNASYYYDEYTNQFHVAASVNISGIWGNPAAVNPYYTMMEMVGLNTNSGLSLQQAVWNGEYYQFDEVVWLHAQADAKIRHFINHEGLPLMNGSMSTYMQGGGAIPTYSSSFVTLYDHVGGPGDRNQDWQISFYSEWLVTSSFHQLPTPGASALLGLGGLVAMRRRRR